MKPGRGERGLTLIEGMMALAILAITSLAISGGEFQALQSGRRSMEKLQATAAAEEIIELMRRNNKEGAILYSALNTSNACPVVPAIPRLFDGDCAQWQQRVTAISGAIAVDPFPCGILNVTVACGWVAIGPGPVGTSGLSTVTVTIVWPGPGNPDSITVNTIVDFES